MKARPRRVENRVAEVLTEKFRAMGVDCLYERIPVLGREGPDLTWEKNNPLGLAIDVKSRLEISRGFFERLDADQPTLFRAGHYPVMLAAWRLRDQPRSHLPCLETGQHLNGCQGT